MIIIINGSVGSGKSSVSWELMEMFEKSVMLDGDYIGAVHPFEIYDDERIDYLYKTIANLVRFHSANGYMDFVINYVFETPQSLNKLMSLLKNIAGPAYAFRLTCSEDEQERRILQRNTDQVQWELERYKELNSILDQAGRGDLLGRQIETDGMDIQQIARNIREIACTKQMPDS